MMQSIAGRFHPVLIGIVVFFFVSAACSIPIGDAPVTPTPAPGLPTAGAPLPTATGQPPVLPTATEIPPVGPGTGEILIYMVALGDNGASGPSIGCGDSLIPVRRTIEPTTQPIVSALNVLFSVKDQYYGESGLYNALWQSNLTVESAQVDAAGKATVSLAGQHRLGGTCDTPRFKAQIEQTVLSVGGVTSAEIFLNGQAIDEALSQQ